MKRYVVIGALLIIVTLSMGTALISSNMIEFGFPFVFRVIDNNESKNDNEIQKLDKKPTLNFKSATYDRLTNELNVSVELWTEEEFSYFGNVHPFLIEIVNSKELTIINSQCFCSENHYFPTGLSTHTTIGWFAYKDDPHELISNNFTLPKSIWIKIHLENELSSDPFELFLV
ncbi:MAG: hypothetical protein ACW981_07150 [Candidatus Hodarchaeales archaeon]